MKVVFISSSFVANTQERGSGAPIYRHISQTKEQKLHISRNSQGLAYQTDQFFCGGRSPLRDASFLHTAYTNLHSGTLLCRYFSDTSLRDGPVQNTRNTTRRVKNRPPLAAIETAQGYVFENRTWHNKQQASASTITVAAAVTGALVANPDEIFRFFAAIASPIRVRLY